MMPVLREGRYPNLAVKFLVLLLLRMNPDTQARMADLSGGEKFDLLVIGGGITGCGVARDASMRVSGNSVSSPRSSVATCCCGTAWVTGATSSPWWWTTFAMASISSSAARIC
jgi:hypothetical protein